MVRSLYFLVIFSFIFTSCKEVTSASPLQVNALLSSPTKEFSGKYYYCHNHDSIILHLTQNPDNLTGSLNIYTDTIAQGIFTGYLRDSILIADYTYTKQDSTQIKQIAIRFKGTQALLGDGPTHTRGNKTQFNNVTTLNYNQSPELNKMPTP